MARLFVIEGKENTGKTHIAWLVFNLLRKNGTVLEFEHTDNQKNLSYHEVLNDLADCYYGSAPSQIGDFRALLEFHRRRIAIFSAGDYGHSEQWHVISFDDNMAWALKNGVDDILCSSRIKENLDGPIKHRIERDFSHLKQTRYQTSHFDVLGLQIEQADNIANKIYEDITNMCDMRRTIWPVGHGAFYTEKWQLGLGKTFNVVYDCGSGNASTCGQYSPLAKCIASAFPNGEIIDALYISHFHNDHINGMMRLINNRQVKAIYLPKLTPNRIVESLLFLRMHSFLSAFVQTAQFLQRIVSRDDSLHGVRIYEVPETDEPNNNEEDNGEVIKEYGGEIGNEAFRINIRQYHNYVIGLTAEVANPNHIKKLPIWWIYKPYNPKDTHTLSGTELESYIKPNGQIDFDGLVSFIRNKSSKYIREIYENIYGKNHNVYSMALYSGFNHLCWRYWRAYNLFKGHSLDFVNLHNKWIAHYNCLYTGDFEPNAGNNMSNIMSYYKPQWDFIGLLQVPHHGSFNNYHNNFYTNNKECFISVGTHDPYKHPDQQTLTNISTSGCSYVIVTEKPLTKQQYQYQFL